jgi:hypothetical protein
MAPIVVTVVPIEARFGHLTFLRLRALFLTRTEALQSQDSIPAAAAVPTCLLRSK